MQGEAAHHLGRVLRAQAGQLYELSDGARVWLGRVEKAGRDEIEFSLLEPIPGVIPLLETTLLLSIVKFDSFEWALEKATELGVTRIVPLAAARSEKALVAAAERRAERWRKILLEASQQSRRVRLPGLAAVENSEDAFSGSRAALKVLLSERPDAAPLRKVMSGQAARSVALAIGPEGGWTESEFSAAEKAGFLEASVGQLILRTETAVIAALAVVNYEYGDERGGKPGSSDN